MRKLILAVLIFSLLGCKVFKPKSPGIYCLHGDNNYLVLVTSSTYQRKQLVKLVNGDNLYIEPKYIQHCPALSKHSI